MAQLPKSLTRHGIGGLVLAAALSMSLLLIGIGAFAVNSAATLHARIADVTTRDLSPLLKLRLAQNNAFNATISSLVKSGTDDPAVIAAMDKEIATYGGQVIPGLEDTVAASPAELKDAASALIAGWQDFEAASAQYESDPNAPNAMELMNKTNELYGTVMADMDALVDRFAADAAQQKVSVDRTYAGLRTTTIFAVAIGALIAITVGFLMFRNIRRRAATIVAATDRLAGGDFTQRLAVTSADELGRMATALNSASATLQQMIGTVAGSAETLRESSSRMDGVNHELAESSTRTGVRAVGVADAAEQVSLNVQTVAAASEQMTASVAEISRNAADAAKVAHSAVTVADEARAVVSHLADSSTQITSVVKLITAIAAQTNLLALNATIEASRAGEAGKGFAVVAGEVKELAQETAKATDEISRQIASVQADAERAVATIGQVTDVIGQINDYTTGIASAVEEQTATTSEMTRTISQAAGGVGAIAASAGEVTAAVGSTDGLVSRSRAASTELAAMSDDLGRLVGGFRY